MRVAADAAAQHPWQRHMGPYRHQRSSQRKHQACRYPPPPLCRPFIPSTHMLIGKPDYELVGYLRKLSSPYRVHYCVNHDPIQTARRRHHHLHRDEPVGHRAQGHQPRPGLSRFRSRPGAVRVGIQGHGRRPQSIPLHARRRALRSHRRQGARAVRPRLRSRDRDHRHQRRHRGADGHRAGRRRQRRRGRRHRALLRLVPARDPPGRWHRRVRARAHGRRSLLPHRLAARARRHAQDAPADAELPAQPHRRRARRQRPDALEAIVRDTGVLLLSDEVYEHIVFDGKPHASVARRPLLAEHAFVISSFGKTYHTTGWKIGYCCAPRQLSAELRKVHQFMVFTVPSPMQYALAEFMRDPSPTWPCRPSTRQARPPVARSRKRVSAPCPAPARSSCWPTTAISPSRPKPTSRATSTVNHGVTVIPCRPSTANPTRRNPITASCASASPEATRRWTPRWSGLLRCSPRRQLRRQMARSFHFHQYEQILAINVCKQSQREFARGRRKAPGPRTSSAPAAPRLPVRDSLGVRSCRPDGNLRARRRRMSCGTTTTAPAATHKLMATGL